MRKFVKAHMPNDNDVGLYKQCEVLLNSFEESGDYPIVRLGHHKRCRFSTTGQYLLANVVSLTLNTDTHNPATVGVPSGDLNGTNLIPVPITSTGVPTSLIIDPSGTELLSSPTNIIPAGACMLTPDTSHESIFQVDK